MALMESGGGTPAGKYLAFISYSHHDRRWARWLHRAIESYSVPTRLRSVTADGTVPERLRPVFLDREELATSADLAASVRVALESSRFLIVVCSPAAAASRWVNEEIRHFKDLGRGARILCLIVDGEPNAAATVQGASRECFPPALRSAATGGQVTDTPATEPLAADVRPGMDEPRDARLKIAAGLLGVDLDELRRRDQARRNKRLVMLAGASAAACLILAALAAVALIARNDAQRQRTIAEQQSLTARRTADFMKSLFEVSDPGEARGNTITAREILDRGASQIDRGLRDEPGVRAELTTTLGEVYTSLGLYRAALALLDRARAIDVRDVNAVAHQTIALAEIELLLGHYTQAEERFETAIRMIERQPQRDSALLARALTGRGELLFTTDRYKEARQSFLRAIAISRHDARADQAGIARATEGLAASAFYSKDYDLAEREYREALQMRVRVSGEMHPKVSETLSSLGSIEYMRGNNTGAEAFYERALRIDRRVLGNHPDVALTINNLARVRLERRHFAEAAQLLEESMRLMLAEKEETHDDMAFVFDNLALARAGMGNDAAAEALFEKALRAAVAHNHRLRGPILTELADLECRTSRFAAGLQRLDEARPLVAARYPDERWRAALIDNVRAACLMGERRLSEVEPLLADSTAVLLTRWGTDGLYGSEALQRAIRFYSLVHDEAKLARYRSLER